MITGRASQPYIQHIRLDGLRMIGTRPALSDYVRQLWGRRHFIVADSRAKVSSNMRQMILGNTWLVLKPVLNAAVYLLIFGILLQTNRGIDNFIGYLVIGVFMFNFTARSLSSGANSVASGRNLMRAFSFPKASLPISAVLRETLNAIPALVAMMLMVIAIPPHAVITWRWLIFPAVFALQIIFNLGIAMIAARLVAKIRDLSNLISLFTRFWLYGSGVFFSYDRFINHPKLLLLMEANPLFQVLDISRDLLLYGETPEPRAWAILAAWAVTALGVGLIFFWRGERNYARD